jgi:hypothetical protein
MKSELASVPAPSQTSSVRSGSSAAPLSADITAGYRTLQTKRFGLDVPANWQVFQNQDSDSATVVPHGGLSEGRNGRQEKFPDRLRSGKGSRAAGEWILRAHHLPACPHENGIRPHRRNRTPGDRRRAEPAEHHDHNGGRYPTSDRNQRAIRSVCGFR